MAFDKVISDKVKGNGTANEFWLDMRVTDNQTGSLNGLKPTGVLDIFQTAAGIHAEKLGISMQKLMDKGRCWVLESVCYERLKAVDLHSAVRVRTRFADPGRLFCVRDYLLTDCDGNELVVGYSRWLIMDLQTRKPIADAVDYGLGGAFEPCAHEKIRKSMDGAERLGEYRVRRSDLDIVGHLNNTRYADVIFEFFPADLECLQIDYVKECRYGEVIEIFSAKADGFVFVEGRCGGERRFISRLKTADKTIDEA